MYIKFDEALHCGNSNTILGYANPIGSKDENT
jgi:hypothetical protein